MTGCDCGGNVHNEEHADDCAGWRLEVERLREALRDVAERQRQACAEFMERERWHTPTACRAAPLVEPRTSMFGVDFPPCPRCGRSVLVGACCATPLVTEDME